MEDGHQDRLFLYFYAILLRYTPVFLIFAVQVVVQRTPFLAGNYKSL